MQSSVLRGVIAGAAGTMALDVVTYADIVWRGRGSSDVPAQLAGKMADALGISLTEKTGDAGKEQASNRKSGIGSLLGYATGITVGIAASMLAPSLAQRSVLERGIVVGLAAMTASDVPIVASGLSDPRTWGAAGWASDLIPHLVYGLVTVATENALRPTPAA